MCYSFLRALREAQNFKSKGAQFVKLPLCQNISILHFTILRHGAKESNCPGNPDHPLLRFSSKVYGILETLSSYILFPTKCYISTTMLCPVTNPKYTSPMFVQISCQIPSIYSANFSHLPFLIPKFPNQSISNCILLQGTLDQNKVISVQ